MEAACLQLEYLPSADLLSQPDCWWNTVLGVIGFEKQPALPLPRVPVTASMTPSLGSDEFCEVWRVAGGPPGNGLTNGLLERGGVERGGVHYRYGDQLLFGSIVTDEKAFKGNASASLLQATTGAYDAIFALLKHTGYHHLIRIWNYLPSINGAADGDERYRHFNAARRSAFSSAGRSTTGTVPAASALGSPAGSPISIYFLASSNPPTMIENPRQTSAYFYPSKYGAQSPIFSRACLSRGAGGTNLFVSGTASIIGHETIHRGDVAAQTRESLANIQALLEEANRIAGTTPYSLDALKFKVYVRRSTDLDTIRNELSMALLPSASVVYLLADVCREDLLVEIEAAGKTARS